MFFLLALFQTLIQTATALEETLATVDLGQAGQTRANLDSLSGIRTAGATIPLVAKYQFGVSGSTQSGWPINGTLAAMDSESGPVALGLLLQVDRLSEVQLDQLPGWRLADEELEQQQLDVLAGGSAAISLYRRQLGLSVGAFYLTQSSGTATPVQGLELNASVAGQFSQMFIAVLGTEDLLGVSGERRVSSAIRYGSGAQPISGPFRNYGGAELDVVTHINENGFGLSSVGLSAEVPVADEVVLRSGYRFVVGGNTLGHLAQRWTKNATALSGTSGEELIPSYLIHEPAFGIGLDSGSVAIEYSFALGFLSETAESAGDQIWLNQHHSLGLRFRL